MSQQEIAKQIDKYLEDSVADEAVLPLLKLCLGRVLKRLGEGWKDAVTRDDFRHICDWLSAALLDKSPWLSRMDDLGRPKKLMKFSTVKGILAEADKAMLVFAQKHGNLKLAEGEETVWLDLENGYVLVRLLTAAALDRESAVMQHCIGGGGYDRYLESGERLLLSLRDAYGKAHATIEVRVSDGRIVQLQGKQNALPDRRYLAAMRTAFLRADFNPSEIMEGLGFVLSSSGEMLDKHNLPPGVEIVGDLSFCGSDFDLPEGLTVLGTLKIHGYRHCGLPSGLTVRGAFVLTDSDIERLPADLTVLGNIDINGPLRGLPQGFTAPANLRLRSVSFSRFPNEMTVAGSLVVEDSSFPHLPASLKVGGTATFTGCVFSEVEDGLALPGDLTFSQCRIGTLGDGISVGGDLDLTNSSVVDVPKALVVGGSLRMHFARIAEIPHGWTVGGSIEAGGSSLSALPGRDIVHGDLYLDDAKVEELESLRFVAGKLQIAHTRVTSLPGGLVVKGDLDATHSSLSGLPEDLKVGGRLLLSASKIRSLPHDLSVTGACDLSNTPINELPEGFSCGRYLDVMMTGVRRIPRGARLDRLMCDESIVEIEEDVLIPHGIILTQSEQILSVEAMRERLATKKAA